MSGLIGRSRKLRKVLEDVDVVARTNTTVLIYGEPGTGKELIAEAIHTQSERRGALVKVNCAAVPASLIESELMGHEKGAFTGAVSRRVGRSRQLMTGRSFSTRSARCRSTCSQRCSASSKSECSSAWEAIRRFTTERPGHRSDKPRSSSDGREANVSRGPVLPAQRIFPSSFRPSASGARISLTWFAISRTCLAISPASTLQ